MLLSPWVKEGVSNTIEATRKVCKDIERSALLKVGHTLMQRWVLMEYLLSNIGTLLIRYQFWACILPIV